MAVRALMTDGSGINGLHYRGSVVKINHLDMPPGGPLTSEVIRCKATIGKGRWSWWLFCECGKTAHYFDWDKAYRMAYRHVRRSWLLDALAELGRGDD